jgi:hypothetical protein
MGYGGGTDGCAKVFSVSGTEAILRYNVIKSVYLIAFSSLLTR